MAKSSADSGEREVIPEFNRGADAGSRSAVPVAVVLDKQLTLGLSGAGCSDPAPNLHAAIDLLERQACNCFHKKVTPCLRCELLGLLNG